jgi:hypothetical protein
LLPLSATSTKEANMVGSSFPCLFLLPHCSCNYWLGVVGAPTFPCELASMAK